ncbi:MAG: peptidoglycan bridge formation glycyltransferase FemA/FemB family protein [Candidatus Kerfeldbacteria bacterium]|nr:peptidoglycan bridge formation glycyltransferase FemA/FemB family protein [Candidatus Kerfeldbacteria bacterium]
MFVVRPLAERQELEQLIAAQPLHPFLQSWAWGDFQASVGRKIWRLGGYEEKQLGGAALVIEHQILLGKTYLYCPRGPLASNRAVFDKLLAAIQRLAAEQGAMYAKADPGRYSFALSAESLPAGYELGTPLQPRQTLLIDLRPSTAELLAAMHRKTRYNIRLAERKGVTIRWSKSAEDISLFLSLLHQTAARQGIRLHGDDYYRQLITILGAAGMAELVIGEYHGQALAAHLMIWHGQTATYLHGASSGEQQELMAPHLVQWRSIERAKQRGCTTYDFWGVAPADQPGHKWAGITRFKKGFGGHVEVFPPAVNAIIQPQWYWAYRMAKRLRGGVDE